MIVDVIIQRVAGRVRFTESFASVQDLELSNIAYIETYKITSKKQSDQYLEPHELAIAWKIIEYVQG